MIYTDRPPNGLYRMNNAKYGRVNHGKGYLEPEGKEDELGIQTIMTNHMKSIRYDSPRILLGLAFSRAHGHLEALKSHCRTDNSSIDNLC